MSEKRRIIIEYDNGADLKEIAVAIEKVWENDEGCDEYRSWFYFKDEKIVNEVK
jgi:hypothetical protein